MLFCPDVSVLMPVYNEEDHITAAIQSVLQQPGVDVELVVVDDGSTDGTFDTIERMDDPRIVLLAQQNAGKVAAFNRAYERSTGSFICLLAGDDLMEQGSLQKRLQPLASRDPDDPAVCLCRIVTLSKNARYDGVVMPKDADRGARSGGAILFNRAFGNVAFPIPGNLANEDMWLILHAEHLSGVALTETPVIGVQYRIHEGNAIERDAPYPRRNDLMHRRYIVYGEFLREYRDELGSSSITYLEAVSAAESLRFIGSTVSILWIGELSLRERLKYMVYSSRSLYRLRMRFFRHFSGWL